MKVRMVDVDSKMANIALMKISSYHKQKGRDVGWHNPIIDGKVDILYIAKVFDFTDDYLYSFADKIVKGGTGYDITSRLPGEIDNVKALDYSIYSDCDYSIQFFSRGCIRSCPFCIVREKEGDIRPAEPMELNPSGERIEVLDNNFFANPEWKSAITQLLKWNQPVNFHGIDARIMTEEHSYYLNQLKHYKQIHIAWDNPKENILPKLKHITRWIKPYKLMCYVLIGYWSTPEEDLYRVETLRGLGVDPFVMPFDKSDLYQRKFARWVNHKAIFKSVKWEDYVA